MGQSSSFEDTTQAYSDITRSVGQFMSDIEVYRPEPLSFAEVEKSVCPNKQGNGVFTQFENITGRF